MVEIDYKHITGTEQGKVTKFWFPDKSSCYIMDKGNLKPETYVMFNLKPDVIKRCQKAIDEGKTDTYDVGFTKQEILILFKMIVSHHDKTLETQK